MLMHPLSANAKTKIHKRLERLGVSQKAADSAVTEVDKAASSFVKKLNRLGAQPPRNRQTRVLCQIQKSHNKTLLRLSKLEEKHFKAAKRLRRYGFSRSELERLRDAVDRAIKRAKKRKDRKDGLRERTGLVREIIKICDRHCEGALDDRALRALIADVIDGVADVIDGVKVGVTDKSIDTAIKRAREPQGEESDLSDQEEDSDLSDQAEDFE